MPTDAGFLGRTLTAGWELRGGGRSLFFNTAGDAAWTVDLSLANANNHGQHSDQVATLYNVIVPASDGSGPTETPFVNVTTASLNRTWVELDVGRDWFLMGGAGHCCCGKTNCSSPEGEIAWRVGCDTGFRWGTADLEMQELPHRTHTLDGWGIGLHSDLEIPYGCCTFLVGTRVEWAKDWCRILQDTTSGLQTLDFMLTAGVRY